MKCSEADGNVDAQETKKNPTKLDTNNFSLAIRVS